MCEYSVSVVSPLRLYAREVGLIMHYFVCYSITVSYIIFQGIMHSIRTFFCVLCFFPALPKVAFWV